MTPASGLLQNLNEFLTRRVFRTVPGTRSSRLLLLRCLFFKSESLSRGCQSPNLSLFLPSSLICSSLAVFKAEVQGEGTYENHLEYSCQTLMLYPYFILYLSKSQDRKKSQEAINGHIYPLFSYPSFHILKTLLWLTSG